MEPRPRPRPPNYVDTPYPHYGEYQRRHRESENKRLARGETVQSARSNYPLRYDHEAKCLRYPDGTIVANPRLTADIPEIGRMREQYLAEAALRAEVDRIFAVRRARHEQLLRLRRRMKWAWLEFGVIICFTVTMLVVAVMRDDDRGPSRRLIHFTGDGFDL